MRCAIHSGSKVGRLERPSQDGASGQRARYPGGGGMESGVRGQEMLMQDLRTSKVDLGEVVSSL